MLTLFLGNKLFCFKDIVFDRQAAFLWKPIVSLCMSTCPFIHKRHSAIQILQKTEKKMAVSLNFPSSFSKDNVLSHKNSNTGDYVDCIYPNVMK